MATRPSSVYSWRQQELSLLSEWRLFTSLFLGLSYCRPLLWKVLCWFYEKENSSIASNSDENCFGAATDNDNKRKKINVCFLYVKFYFHFQKMIQCECNWDVFLRKLKFYVENRRFRLVQFVLFFSQSKQNLAKFSSWAILRKLNRSCPVEISCNYVVLILV